MWWRQQTIPKPPSQASGRRHWGCKTVSTTANFFDLGGHSLLVVQVQRQMRDALARDIAITDIFRFPTVRALGDPSGRMRQTKTSLMPHPWCGPGCSTAGANGAAVIGMKDTTRRH